jgi:hypothetical protein
MDASPCPSFGYQILNSSQSHQTLEHSIGHQTLDSSQGHQTLEHSIGHQFENLSLLVSFFSLKGLDFGHLNFFPRMGF